MCVARLGLLALVGLLALLQGAVASARLAVTGFQNESSPTRLIDRNAAALSTVSVDGISLTGSGVVSAPDRAALRQLATAHRDGLRAELLVNNWSNAINDFSEPLAFATLRRRAAIARVAAALAGDVRTDSWNGITVDIESLAPRDRAGLTTFLTALRARLPASAALGVTVSNYTRAAQFAAAGYELAGVGATADQVILMAYDEHGPWEDTPGPIGALAWQRAGLNVVLRFVPASKVDLGVAGYGYAWRPHHAVSLSDAQARALVARFCAKAHYVASVGEWTATLRDGSTVWWSDARSLARRAQFASALHLHGLAVWSLGLSYPIAI
jgi:spore germination protein